MAEVGALILASGSARRRDLLRAAGVPFAQVTADVDESLCRAEQPQQAVQRLAAEKATAISASHPEAVVIGADTLVALGDQILGKPDSLEHATEMLQLLSGKTHAVYTGVHIACANRNRATTWYAFTEVTFNTLTDTTIENYFAVCDPLDKAGSYGIQTGGDLLVSRTNGLLSTVIGFPIEQILPRLRSFYNDCGFVHGDRLSWWYELPHKEVQPGQIEITTYDQAIAALGDAQ